MLNIVTPSHDVLQALIEACAEAPFPFAVCDREGRVLMGSTPFESELARHPAPQDYRPLVSRALCEAGDKGTREIVIPLGPDQHLTVTPVRSAQGYGLIAIQNRHEDKGGKSDFFDRSYLDVALNRDDKFALILCNIDRFRSVNETFGHATGDLLLRAAVQRIARQLEADQLLMRTAGDEFAIIIPARDEDTLAAATDLAEHLVELIARPFMLNEHVLHVGLSAGVALRDDLLRSPGDVLRHADLALDFAKRSGRSQVRVFDQTLDDRANERYRIESDLLRAVALGELQVFYQPQVSLPDRKLIGCEALLRWNHPEHGMIPPSQFIPIAEESGIIATIGDWVLKSICAQAAHWPKDLRVAVNLSPVQIRHPHLVSRIGKILARTGLDPERLELEITEGVLLQDNAATLKTLKSLKALGVKIAMDDFGTGYSSLSYLNSFAFDKVKIDKSFVRDMTTSPEAAAIVRAVLGIGSDLDIAVIAEGVETEEQIELLASNHCPQIQGYLIGQPVPLNTFEEIWL